MHSSYEAIWLTLTIVVLGVEGVALARRKGGDTLTEFVRKQKATWFVALLGALLVWLFYHFIIDKDGSPTRVDVIVVLMGVALTLALHRVFRRD